MNLSDEQWKSRLSPKQYEVLRKKGTEAPFSGEFLDNQKDGIYTCGACGVKLFSSDTKYDSTTPGLIGWPSFYDVVESGAVKLEDDNSLGMKRAEAVCSNCGSHLGHLFDDKSAPNGQHYCINSCALNFKPKSQDDTA